MSNDWIRKLTPYRIMVALFTGLMLGYLLQVVLVVFNHWVLAPLMFIFVGGCVLLIFVIWMQHQPGLIGRE